MVFIRSIHLYAVEKVTLIYMLITSVIIVCLMGQLSNTTALLANRLLFTTIILLLSAATSYKNIWPIRFIRYAFLGALFSYWYTETYDINRAFANYDFLIARLEQMVFGCQPALYFSDMFSQKWVSEIFNMAYFSYYPLIIGTCLYFFFTNRKYFEYFFFCILFSFLSFYLLFILFPTAGPQYYYPAIGLDTINAGVFPEIGHYFNANKTLLQSSNDSGIFFRLVENSQQVGERPTAAFPSSHIGISVLIMIMIFKSRRKLLFVLLFPLVLALIGATVYIQAHYVVDVLAGFVFAVGFYFLSAYVYKKMVRRNYGTLELTPHYLTKKKAERKQKTV